MKKSLLALLFAVALVVPAVAENMWVGGSLGFNTTSPKKGDSISSFSIQPEFGYNLNEKMGLGIDLGYAYQEGVTNFAGNDIPAAFSPDKVTTISISPFIRYEMFKIGDFAFLAKGSIYYESSKLKESDVSFTTYGIQVVPVVTYSINKTWSIDAILDFASISFESIKCDDSAKLDMENTNFGFKGNSGNLVSIGFSYHF